MIPGRDPGTFAPNVRVPVGFPAAPLITIFRLRTMTSTFFREAVVEPAVTLPTVLLIPVAAKIFRKSMAQGFDPVRSGILTVIIVECALITPPIRLDFHVIQSLARTKLAQVARRAGPCTRRCC